MSIEIKVPDLGGAEDVEVIELLVKNGDTVAVDDPLITVESCLLYTSPSPRDLSTSRMPSSA